MYSCLQGSRRQKPSLFEDQNLQSLSDLYRPDKNNAWNLAALVWYGLPSSEVHIGWGEDKERKEGWRYFREESSVVRESLRCQYSVTFCLHSFLKASFGRGVARRVRGWGSRYWMVRSRTRWNQEQADGFASVGVATAIDFRGLLSSR